MLAIDLVLAATLVAVTAAFWFLPGMVAQTISFGVRIPPAYQSDSAVRAATRGFRLRLALSALISLALLLLIARPSVTLIAPQLLFLALFFANYLVAHRQVLRAKQAGHWFVGLHQGAAAATAPDLGQGAFPWLYLLPALLLIALTAVVGALRYPALPAQIAVHFNLSGQPNRYASKSWGSALFPLWVELVVTSLLVALSYFTWRSPRQLDPAHPEASLQRSWRFRTGMIRLLLLLVAAVNLTLLASGLLSWGLLPSALPVHLGIVLVPLLAAVAVVLISYRMGQEGVRLPSAEGPDTGLVARDDDRLWKGGLVYFNPQDPAIIVAKRFGIGWTFNFGRWQAWLLIPAIAAVVLALRLLVR
jgi:uncharacterized membrane protein